VLKSAVPELIGALRDENEDLHNAGLKALSKLGGHSWS